MNKQEILDILRKNFSCDGKVTIDEDGLVNVAGNVSIKEERVQNIKTFEIKFGKVSGYFDCSACRNLTSLKGAPTEVGTFFCNYCDSLTNLKGSPWRTNGNFYCNNCPKLTSLKGAPEEILKGVFDCSNCQSLINLEGSPKRVDFQFICKECNNLITLKGAPKIVWGSFNCSGCKNLKTLEDFKTCISGLFIFNGCVSLPIKQSQIAEDSDLFKKWIDSNLSADDFYEEKRGTIASRRFGF